MSRIFSLFLKITLIYFFLLGAFTQASFAQITSSSDTSNQEEYYGFPDIDFEIEKIKKYLRNTTKTQSSAIQIANVDTSFRKVILKINKEEKEFDNYNHKNLSKFFLINTHRIWTGYKTQLKDWQNYIFDNLSSLEKQTITLIERENKWKKTLNRLNDQNGPVSLKDRIKKVLKEIKKLKKDNYHYSIKLINLENDITDQLIFVENVIDEVEQLQENYRSELFTVSDSAIWNITLKGTIKGSINESLSRAWYENTKSFKNNADAYRNNSMKFLIICFISLIIVIFLKLRFNKKIGGKKKSIKYDLNYILISRPISSLLSIFILFFFIAFRNIPLALTGGMGLILLITMYISLEPYLKNAGKKIILRFIILVALNNLEIIFWYFGNYSRIFISLETLLGVLFTYEYLGKKFTYTILPNLRFKRVIGMLRYPIFFLFLIGFLANVIGILNLAVLFLKIGTQLTSAFIVIIGLWHITLSLIHVLVDLIRNHENLKMLNYVPLLKKRLTQIFSFLFLYMLLYVVLSVLELEAPFNHFIDEFLNNERNLGGITYAFSSIFQFIISILVTWFLYALVGVIFNNQNFKKSQSLRGVPQAIGTTLRIIIGTVGIMIALTAAGFDMGKLSIIMGALGVGIGFGLQNVVNNFISGLILIYERPVQVGDVIEVGNLMGEIKSIGIRSSNIRTYDGSEVIVPNANLVSDQLINWTLSDDHRRLEIVIGVAYGTDPNLVIELLTKVAIEDSRVVKIPEPRVLFNEFGDSSLNFRLLFWVLFENGLGARSDISVAIDKAFKENGVEIPFPQLDLHVKDPKKNEILDETIKLKETPAEPKVDEKE